MMFANWKRLPLTLTLVLVAMPSAAQAPRPIRVAVRIDDVLVASKREPKGTRDVLRIAGQVLRDVFHVMAVSCTPAFNSQAVDRTACVLAIASASQRYFEQRDEGRFVQVVPRDTAKRSTLTALLPALRRAFRKSPQPGFRSHLFAWSQLEIGDAKSGRAEYRRILVASIANDGPSVPAWPRLYISR